MANSLFLLKGLLLTATDRIDLICNMYTDISKGTQLCFVKKKKKKKKKKKNIYIYIFLYLCNNQWEKL